MFRSEKCRPVSDIYVAVVHDGHVSWLTEMSAVAARLKPNTKNQRRFVAINDKLHHLQSASNQHLLSVIPRPHWRLAAPAVK